MIFINYRRDDSMGMAGRLHDRLAQAFGRKNLFMDVDSISPGIDFVKHLDNQVAACSIFLAVIGPDWLDAKNEEGDRRLHVPDDFVAVEIAAALGRDIRVIPILVDGARMPKASDLPEPLKPLVRRNAFNLRHDQFGRDVEALIERIREARSTKGATVVGWKAVAGIVAVLALVGSISFFVPRMSPSLPRPVQPPNQAEKERPATAQTVQPPNQAEKEVAAAVDGIQKVLGLQLAPSLTKDLRSKYKIKDSVKGVLITGVDGASDAAEKRLAAGDVIEEMAQEAVGDAADFKKRVDQLKKAGKKSILLLVANGDDELRFVALSLQ